MTVMTEVKADPRELCSPETFAKLAAYCERTMKLTRTYAERGVAECLVYMKTMAENPDARRISPSLAVDPFWHAYMLHSAEYHEFETTHAGGRHLTHAPTAPEAYTAEQAAEALTDTIGLLQRTGYAVDLEFWGGWATCGQGNTP